MAYFTSPFGNGVAVGSGGNVTSDVHNFHGPRDTGGAAGVVRTEGFTEQLIIDIVARDFNDGIDTLVTTKLPAGAIIKDVFWETTEVFVVTGTTPTLLIGTATSEVTNGFVISESNLETVGVYNKTSTLAGTWDAEAPLAAQTTVGVALGGTSPVITDAGKGRAIIVYVRAGS
jgi:hypothetical protein